MIEVSSLSILLENPCINTCLSLMKKEKEKNMVVSKI